MGTLTEIGDNVHTNLRSSGLHLRILNEADVAIQVFLSNQMHKAERCDLRPGFSH